LGACGLAGLAVETRGQWRLSYTNVMDVAMIGDEKQ